MDDEELIELYDGFAQTMRDNGLAWVVNQVEEQLSEPPERDEFNNNLPLDTYTPEERLLILLRAAEFVIVDTASMEGEIVNFFLKPRTGRILPFSYYAWQRIDAQDERMILRGKDRVTYEDEVEAEQDRLEAHEVDLQLLSRQRQQRQDSAQQFQALINRIRNEILNG